MTANNTVDTTATTVEVTVDTTPEVDSTVDTKTPEVKAEAPEAKPETPEVKAEPAKGKTEAAKDKAKLEQQRTESLDQLKAGHAQALETNGHYKDWGFVYAAPAPIANAIGGEIGFTQRNNETMTVQRTGIGIYLRSDHVFSAKLDACTERF
jgi:hypothetical protein